MFFSESKTFRTRFFIICFVIEMLFHRELYHFKLNRNCTLNEINLLDPKNFLNNEDSVPDYQKTLSHCVFYTEVLTFMRNVYLKYLITNLCSPEIKH